MATLKIKKATVLTGIGPDRVTLDLDAPTAFPEMQYPAQATVETRPGFGAEWCRTTLGVEPEVIEARGSYSAKETTAQARATMEKPKTKAQLVAEESDCKENDDGSS